MLPNDKNKVAMIVFVSMIVFLSVIMSLHYTQIEGILYSDPSTMAAFNNGMPTWLSEITRGADNSVITCFHLALNITVSSHIFYLKGCVLSRAIKPILISFATSLIFLFYEHTRHKLVKQDAPGKESGSSKWFDDFKNYNKKYVDPYTAEDKAKGLYDNNMILAKDLKLSMNNRKTRLNTNVLVIGGSGTGKTFGVIKPNILQMNSSFVITDPSGEILTATGHALIKNGYDIKVFSTSDMLHSNVYNPFDYIYDGNGNLDETKVKVMVDTFLTNMGGGKKGGGGDKFWDNAAAAWLTFAVFFLVECFPKPCQNMYSVLQLAQMGKVDENGNDKTKLDALVDSKKEESPNHEFKFTVAYDTYKLAPAKTANSILISLGVYLEPFGSAERVRNLTTTSYLCTRKKDGSIDEYIKNEDSFIRDNMNLNLDQLGDKKTALFVNIPQANGTYNFLVSMMYSQMFDTLYERAEKISGERYHIADANNQVISSQYKTEEEAEKMLALYKKAVVKQHPNNNKWYLYSFDEKADKDEIMFTRNHTLPEISYVYGKGGKTNNENNCGWLCEVYDEEVGQIFLKQYAGGSVIKGRPELPVQLRCLLDEFANIGEIPEFNEKLATMRKYKISCTIILQSLAQIKEKYEKLWESMVGNCDTMIFLGSAENETDKYVSERLGKATIRTASISQSNGSRGSSSQSFQKKERSLMDMAEISKMDNLHCIINIRSMHPFYLEKYNLTKHPNFDQTGDANPDLEIKQEYLNTHFACSNKKDGKYDDFVALAKLLNEQNHQRKKDLNNKTEPSSEPVRNEKEFDKVYEKHGIDINNVIIPNIDISSPATEKGKKITDDILKSGDVIERVENLKVSDIGINTRIDTDGNDDENSILFG